MPEFFSILRRVDGSGLVLGFTHYLHAEAEILKNLINLSLPIVNLTRDQHLQHLTEVRVILPLKNESWNSDSIIRFTLYS